MGNTEKLLRALIDALEFDIEESKTCLSETVFKLTKRKKQVKARKAKDTVYTEVFNRFWEEYPSRGVETNSKSLAFKRWQANIKKGVVINDMYHGAVRYKKQCDVLNKTGTSFVLQASTFLGPSRHYLEEWALPEPKKEKIKLPFRNEDLEGFAKERGLSSPGRTDTYTEYRRKLQAEIDRLDD